MDVCKIAPGRYHYAAVDDCTRYKVMGLYPRRTAANTISASSKKYPSRFSAFKQTGAASSLL